MEKIHENSANQAMHFPEDKRYQTNTTDSISGSPASQWNSFMSAIDMFSADFFEHGREDIFQERESL